MQTPMAQTSIEVVDMHTAGEPVRIVTAGYPVLTGETLLDKRREAAEKHDYLRRRLMLEPRGHGGMYGVIPTKPSSDGAALAVLFTHAQGYSTMCGHATIAVGRWAVESGLVEASIPETRFVLECPCGPVDVFVRSEGDACVSGFTSVPAYAETKPRIVEVPGRGGIPVSLAFGGAYYAILPASALGLDFDHAGYPKLVRAAGELFQAALEQISIPPRGEPDLEFLYGVILTDGAPWPAPTRNICVFAAGQVDRSPTGSGVTARMALDYARENIPPNHERTFMGPTGDAFGASIAEIIEGPTGAEVRVRIEGRSYFTGKSSFVFEDRDPLIDGFLLAQEVGGDG